MIKKHLRVRHDSTRTTTCRYRYNYLIPEAVAAFRKRSVVEWKVECNIFKAVQP